MNNVKEWKTNEIKMNVVIDILLILFINYILHQPIKNSNLSNILIRLDDFQAFVIDYEDIRENITPIENIEKGLIKNDWKNIILDGGGLNIKQFVIFENVKGNEKLIKKMEELEDNIIKYFPTLYNLDRLNYVKTTFLEKRIRVV